MDAVMLLNNSGDSEALQLPRAVTRQSIFPPPVEMMDRAAPLTYLQAVGRGDCGM